MNCTESLALLSDYHDALLAADESLQVRLHLLDCQPCDGIFLELHMIVLTATELRDEDVLFLPDETVFWERLVLHQRAML